MTTGTATSVGRIARHGRRDYLVHPPVSSVSGSARSTLTANLTANLVRNVWSHSVTMCGHFPDGVETFAVDQLGPAESRGQCYLRQMLGSPNISGSRLLHELRQAVTPDRAPHLSRPAQQPVPGDFRPGACLLHRHGLTYNSRALLRQVASAWRKVLRLSRGYVALTADGRSIER